MPTDRPTSPAGQRAASSHSPSGPSKTDAVFPKGVQSPLSPHRPDGIVPAAPDAAGRTLHVVAADADPAALDFYRAALPRLGHRVQVVDSGPGLVEVCGLLRPDLILTAVQLPALDGLAAADAACRARPVPVVLVADGYDPLGVARALAGEWVMACLSRPLAEGPLGAALAVAACRYEQAAALRAEVASLKQALEDRKVIERAKGAVMRRCGLGEDEAYRRMRKLASDSNRRLADFARHILEAEAAFSGLGPA